ncbi:MAG: hypothetical protein R3Y21_01205 [Mycoplasmatota bacterium]
MKDEKKLKEARQELKLFIKKAHDDVTRHSTAYNQLKLEQFILTLLFENVIRNNSYDFYGSINLHQESFIVKHTSAEILQTVIFALTKYAQSSYVDENGEIQEVKDKYPRLILELEAFANCKGEDAGFISIGLLKKYCQIFAWEMSECLKFSEPTSITDTYKVSLKRRFIEEMQRKENQVKRKQLAYTEKLTQKIVIE